MTKAQIEDKLEQTKRHRETHLANVHACTGAIQMLEQILKEWDEPDAVHGAESV